jgi:hypothetical protein
VKFPAKDLAKKLHFQIREADADHYVDISDELHIIFEFFAMPLEKVVSNFGIEHQRRRQLELSL